MTASSLPKYPDRPRPMAPPGNNGPELVSSRRLTALWIRAVWLVGVWGALFAFRSVLLSSEADPPRTEGPSNSIVGTWEATDDSGFALEFTKEQHVRFLWDGKEWYTGLCRRRHAADAVFEIPDLLDEAGAKLPDPRDRFPGPDLEFTVALRGDDLAIASARLRVAPVRFDRPLFPPGHDGTLHLKRKR